MTDLHTDLATLSISELVAVTGGQGPAPQPRPDDAAGKYGATLKQDWNDFNARAAQTAGDLKAGRWGDAALHFGGTLVNEVKMASDALQPVKDLIGLGKK